MKEEIILPVLLCHMTKMPNKGKKIEQTYMTEEMYRQNGGRNKTKCNRISNLTYHTPNHTLFSAYTRVVPIKEYLPPRCFTH